MSGVQHPGSSPVISWIEIYYRAGFIGFKGTPLVLHGSAELALAEAISLVPDAMVEDIVAQAELADSTELANLRAITTTDMVAAATTFAGSTDIRGADADLLVDGALIDIKAAKEPWELPKKTAQQLLGYLLLDYDDELGIDTVGLYTTRDGSLITWPTDRFLALLGARHDLLQLRARTRQICRRPDATYPDEAVSPETRELLRDLNVPDLAHCHHCGTPTPSPRTAYCSQSCRSTARTSALDTLGDPTSSIRPPRPN